MFNGPLSDRIDIITDKPQGESRKKSERRKSVLTLIFKSVVKSQNNQEVWEATQVNCPIPPRNPDQWFH